MQIENVKCFLDVYHDYFEKKREIAVKLHEFHNIRQSAKYLLAQTIDNGLTDDYLKNIYVAYKKTKFDSIVVQDFCKEICRMTVDKLDQHLKENLDIVDLKIDFWPSQSYNCYENPSYGPIHVCFYDRISKRIFTLSIPTRSSIEHMNICFEKWNDVEYGLYVVFASSIEKINSLKKICAKFDIDHTIDAIRKYLSGEFDETTNEVFYDYEETVSIYDIADIEKMKFFFSNDCENRYIKNYSS